MWDVWGKLWKLRGGVQDTDFPQDTNMARVRNTVRMRVFPASGANLPLKLYAIITKQTRFRLRN